MGPLTDQQISDIQWDATNRAKEHATHSEDCWKWHPACCQQRLLATIEQRDRRLMAMAAVLSEHGDPFHMTASEKDVLEECKRLRKQ